LPGEDPDRLQVDDSLEGLIAGWVDPSLVTVERRTVYQFHALLAERWRLGPVFLAGDAAHQTPPFLGQGLCTGIRDAENLAWKLDYVINKGASAELLDTYETERKPRARHLVASAVEFGRLICEIDQEKAARRHATMVADERPPEERMTFRLGRFEAGPLVLTGGGGLFPQPVSGRDRLDDLIGQHFFVLGRAQEPLEGTRAWWTEEVGALVLTLEQLPDYAKAPLESWLDSRRADVAVVRPDRYVLGTGDTLASLTAALEGSLLTSGGEAR
jgi:3-(3-hydroxy-phenyl)propionate hydroxylase